jgi:hypothetical protein|eukprot:COSAG01_NODE_2739_length_7159_cov_15.443343_1_plen_43_part_00
MSYEPARLTSRDKEYSWAGLDRRMSQVATQLHSRQLIRSRNV